MLIGFAHAAKRERRRKRLARLAREAACQARGDGSDAEACALEAAAAEEGEAPPQWVVSETTMMYVGIGALAIGTLTTVLIAVGQQAHASWRARRAARREHDVAREAKRAREAALAEAKAAFALAREKGRARGEAEREEQRKFEAKLLAEIRERESELATAAAAVARAQAAEDEAARREAMRIDEVTRAAAASRLPPTTASGGGGDGLMAADDDDGWDVGDYDEASDVGMASASIGDGGGPAEQRLGGGGGGGDHADDDDDDEEEEEGAIPPPSERLALENNPAARGAKIALEGLVMPDAATARAIDVWVSLSCARCQRSTDLNLGGLTADAASRKSWCDNCGALLSATLRPCLLVTPFSNVVGHVDAVHCHVLDVPRISVLMECGRCESELALPPLQRGRTVQSGCRGCHAPLSLKMGNVLVERLGGAGVGAGGKGAADDDDDELEALLKKLRKKNIDQFKQLGIIVGKPLPNKGACKHYKHSYRWLRFPCCGRAHPCAACHEASDCPAAALGVWANRMICGKCSREAAYSDKPCEHCGNTFTRPGGAHWQGGAGCRDQQRLSTSDSRKYKGSSASGVKKTTSQKSQRVGAAGKRATAVKKFAHAGAS